MDRILLAYDGSDPSRDAADLAGDLARRMGARVTVLTVGELVPAGYGAVEPVVEPEAYERIAEEGAERVRRQGAEAEPRVVWGTPAEDIVRVAEAEGFPLIVMGHRGIGGVASLFLGSVAKAVIDRARCSVLVVR